MLSRRIATARPLRAAVPVARRAVFGQQRCAQTATYDYPQLVRGIHTSELTAITCF
jgi:NADH dehydrogenase (ubiquinone) 1 beta subcomplex subunit 8